jgi:hypothetical protein
LKRRLSFAAAKADPNAAWNAFIDFLAFSTYQELNDVQRAPHLVFCYESEVQNGGHLQFFENRPEELIEPTLQALRALGAQAYVEILHQAISRWRSRQREKIATVEDYVAEALDGEFDDLDRAYYDTQPPITRLLEDYLNANLSEFLLVEG